MVALIPMTSFLPAPGRPPASLGLLPAHGALGRARDRTIEALGEALIWRWCLPHLNRARASVGLAPVAHPLDQLRRADRVLVQTSAWFDFDAAPHENVRYVGPELGDPTWAEPANVDASREPLVLVAFSTTYMGHEKTLARIIRAFEGLPARAIVTTGPSIDPRTFDAPPNVTVLSSAPHAEIMRRASLVVTHGGHGTVIRALANGVPVLCMPMGRDQCDNAARAKHVGAGITLSRRARTSTIRAAIARALEDERLHERARHARDMIAKEMHGDLVIEELEGLVTHA